MLEHIRVSLHEMLVHNYTIVLGAYWTMSNLLSSNQIQRCPNDFLSDHKVRCKGAGIRTQGEISLVSKTQVPSQEHQANKKQDTHDTKVAEQRSLSLSQGIYMSLQQFCEHFKLSLCWMCIKPPDDSTDGIWPLEYGDVHYSRG